MEFKSKYLELGFYVGDQPRKFSNGTYLTDNKEEIEVLNGLVDVEAVEGDEAKPKAKGASKK